MSDERNVPEGWLPAAEPGSVEALRCRYPDDRDVTVSVHEVDAGYEVRDRSESPDSAPKTAVAGLRESLPAARELMIKTCRDWDEWILRRPTLGCN